MVQSSQPVTVRAEYGPFETSQMVPTQYLVPDLMLEQEETEAGEPGKEKREQLALITDFEPHQLDLSAHLVTNEVWMLLHICSISDYSYSICCQHIHIGQLLSTIFQELWIYFFDNLLDI